MNSRQENYPKAILFDLLTALLDSWSLWNRSAESVEAGRAWRAEYLRLTYGCGRYVDYQALVRQSAQIVGLPPSAPLALAANWLTLEPWPEAADMTDASGYRHRSYAFCINQPNAFSKKRARTRIPVQR